MAFYLMASELFTLSKYYRVLFEHFSAHTTVLYYVADLYMFRWPTMKTCTLVRYADVHIDWCVGVFFLKLRETGSSSGLVLLFFVDTYHNTTLISLSGGSSRYSKLVTEEGAPLPGCRGVHFEPN